MSTILDSLKKSSSNRENKDNSTLDNFNFSTHKKSSVAGLFMLVFVLTIVAIVSYFGYQYLNKSSDSATNPSIDQQAQILAQPSATDTTQTNNNQVNKLPKPSSEEVKQQLAQTQMPTQADATNTEQKSEQLNNNTQDTAKQAAEGKPFDTPETEQQPMITLGLADDTKTKQDETANGVTQQDYLYIYQLPFSVRKEIPKFILNIHIYDENPDNRAVVINGSKYELNDLIEEAILVKEIVREGVLLEFNQYQFLLPKL